VQFDHADAVHPVGAGEDPMIYAKHWSESSSQFPPLLLLDSPPSSNATHSSYSMQGVAIRPFATSIVPPVCGQCRKAGLDIYRQPGLRPLHASPIFQRPRRRDFFSSNPSLASANSKDSDAVAGRSEIAQVQKRKTARPNGAKTSLRRVAVEAQRTKVGKDIQTAPPSQDDLETPKLVTAYSVAETFDIPKVVEILRSKGYEPDPLNTGLYPQVVHVQIPVSSIYRSSNISAQELAAHEVGDVFIFPSGTLVTWALPEGFTSYFATRTLLPAANNPQTAEPIETEDLDYIEDATREISSIRGDTIVLGTKPHDQTATDSTPSPHSPQTIDTTLTKIAFSSGFARSTKLAVLETNLSSYLASTAHIPTLLSRGSRLPLRISRKFILRKTGQLLQLRAQLNLYSELTDSLPDLFWDSRHELNLENYYDQVGRALDVGIRIKVLNEKMDYAAEIATVLRERLSEKHGLFLEWTIIVLIAIEVGFEVLRLYREGFWADVWRRGITVDRGRAVE
jgi:required for meiotic nuclear division protein 1